MFTVFVIALHRKPISELRSVTRHMGSRSVTCHPTQVNASRLNPSQIGRYSIYLTRRDGRLSWPRRLVTVYIPRWFTCQQAVTHPSTNPTRCRAISLIGPNALPLLHATNPPNAQFTPSLPRPRNSTVVASRHECKLGLVFKWCLSSCLSVCGTVMIALIVIGVSSIISVCVLVVGLLVFKR